MKQAFEMNAEKPNLKGLKHFWLKKNTWQQTTAFLRQ